MATRARIGIMQKSGRIIASYQHWDGYPGGLGYKLCEHWEDSKKVTDAIKLGDASKWGYIVGKKIDFDKVKYGSDDDLQNCYYGRDRGEKNAGYRVYKDEAEYLKKGFNSSEEYIYLMKDTGDKDLPWQTEVHLVLLCVDLCGQARMVDTRNLYQTSNC